MSSVLLASEEPLALKQLEIAAECLPDLSVVAKATSGAEALALIRKMSPDVAILDLDMRDRSGPEVMKSLGASDPMPELIFTSEHEHHAARAFEIDAVDYLLKPVSFDRLRISLQRAVERLRYRTAEARYTQLQEQLFELEAAQREDSPYHDEIWVRTGKELTRLVTDDIDMIEAAGDYVIVHVGSTSHLLKESLTSLQERLDPKKLLRIHRGWIVNLKRIRNLRRLNRRSMAVILANGQQVTIGPLYAETVLKALDAKRWR